MSAFATRRPRPSHPPTPSRASRSIAEPRRGPGWRSSASRATPRANLEARLLLLELRAHVPERLHRRGEAHLHVVGRGRVLGTSSERLATADRPPPSIFRTNVPRDAPGTHVGWRLGRGTDVGPRVVLVHAALVPPEREGAGVRGGGWGGGADTEASRRRLESTRRLDPGVVPGLGSAAAPTARAGCATRLGPPDMPAKSAGPVSHDPSGVLNRSSFARARPQLPVPAATSRGSKSGEVTGRVPRRPVTHSPGGVGAARARGGVRGCDTRGVGSGGSGRQLGLERFFTRGAPPSSNKRGSFGRARTDSRRPARIGVRVPACWTRTTFQLSGSAPREPPRVSFSVVHPPGKKAARMLNKTVGGRRSIWAVGLALLQVPGRRPRRAPGTSPRAMAASIPEWREKHPADMSSAPRPTPTPTPTSLRAPSPTPPLAGSAGRSRARDARRETVQPLRYSSEPPSR